MTKNSSKKLPSLPQFRDDSLLQTALTHRSSLNENFSPSRVSNERLEFLGDAVLELATTKFLYRKLPKEDEGMLTAFRSALVKTTTLAQVAKSLKLGEKIYMSKGEEATGGRTNPSILADTTEAIIGALYLDQDFQKVEEFLNKHLFPKFDNIKQQKLYRDSKSLLQETVQAAGNPTPEYKVVTAVGPDHNKEFTVNVIVNAEIKGTGRGKSKQQAQQEAARDALEKI